MAGSTDQQHDGGRGRGGDDRQSRIPEVVLVGLGIALVAVVSRLPALETWWCLDDWGQLGRAAGLMPGPEGFPARWLSQHAWWTLTWPLTGTSAVAQAWLRILLHAGAAVLVGRLARHAGLSGFQQLVAGAVFAATPVAFTPLYWASGIQELLAGSLALLAVERWLAGGRLSTAAAVMAGVAAIMAKESPFGLPVLFAGFLLAAPQGAERRPRARWLVPGFLALAVVGEAYLVSGHFASGPNDRYAVGGPLVVLGNLGKFGWWLPTPGPVFTAQMDWYRAAVGLAVWLAWGAWGVVGWRRGRRLALATWGAGLLSVAPALPLLHQANPYLAYLAVAPGSLVLASFLDLRRRKSANLAAAVVVVVIASGWGQACMRARINGVGTDGLPADPIARAVLVSREAAAKFREALPRDLDTTSVRLWIYEPDLRSAAGAGQVHRREQALPPQLAALEGRVGASLSLGRHARVERTRSLSEVPAGSHVVCLKGTGFQDWGPVHAALLFGAELHLAAGQFSETAELLVRAIALDPSGPLRVPARDVLGFPAHMLQPRFVEFRTWLAGQVATGTRSAAEGAVLREFRLGP